MTPGLDEQPKASPLTEEERRTARRVFLTGSLAAAPLITTLASRPAWAGCGLVSVMDSLTHASHDNHPTCSGLPVEYWSMHPDMVEQYVAVGPANPEEYTNIISTPTDYTYPTDGELKAVWPGENKEHKDALKEYRDWLKLYGSSRPTPPFGVTFNECFEGPYADEYLTMMQALWRTDLQLVCQSACAWLNANEFPDYGYTPAQVVALLQTKGMEDPTLLTAAFTAMNTASYIV